MAVALRRSRRIKRIMGFCSFTRRLARMTGLEFLLASARGRRRSRRGFGLVAGGSSACGNAVDSSPAVDARTVFPPMTNDRIDRNWDKGSLVVTESLSELERGLMVSAPVAAAAGSDWTKFVVMVGRCLLVRVRVVEVPVNDLLDWRMKHLRGRRSDRRRVVEIRPLSAFVLRLGLFEIPVFVVVLHVWGFFFPFFFRTRSSVREK